MGQNGPFRGVFGVWGPQEGGVTPREVFVDGNNSVAEWHVPRSGLCVEGATQKVIFRPRKSPRRGGPGGQNGPFGGVFGVWAAQEGGVTPREVVCGWK